MHYQFEGRFFSWTLSDIVATEPCPASQENARPARLASTQLHAGCDQFPITRAVVEGRFSTPRNCGATGLHQDGAVDPQRHIYSAFSVSNEEFMRCQATKFAKVAPADGIGFAWLPGHASAEVVCYRESLAISPLDMGLKLG